MKNLPITAALCTVAAVSAGCSTTRPHGASLTRRVVPTYTSRSTHGSPPSAAGDWNLAVTPYAGSPASTVTQREVGDVIRQERERGATIQGLLGFIDIDDTSLNLVDPADVVIDEGVGTMPALGAVVQLPSFGGERLR